MKSIRLSMCHVDYCICSYFTGEKNEAQRDYGTCQSLQVAFLTKPFWILTQDSGCFYKVIDYRRNTLVWGKIEFGCN